jgi:hypothetical protein
VTRSADDAPPMSRTEAAAIRGLPTFVALAYGPGSTPSMTTVTTPGTDDPQRVAQEFLGVAPLSGSGADAGLESDA